MKIHRIAIRFPVEVAGKIKRAAGKRPVSAWITDVIKERLADADLERQWQAFYREVGPKRGDHRRADAIFRRLTRGSRRRGAA
jgi:hypothetical protein